MPPQKPQDPRKISLDCPYCHNVDRTTIDLDTFAKLKSVWYEGPHTHECTDCRRHFVYLLNIDIITKTFEIPSELSRKPRTQESSE